MKQIQHYVLLALKVVVFISLCSMSLVSVVDASGRYLFNSPLIGSTEIIELLMILVIFGSIPIVSQTQSHVRVDLFQISRLNHILNIQKILVEILNSSVSLLMAYATWYKAKSLIEYGDITQMLSIPLAPFVILIMVLLIFNAFIHLANCFVNNEKEMA